MSKDPLDTALNIIKAVITGTKCLDKKIQKINLLKKELHNISPFKDEPVDCVLWVKKDKVKANDYNPNSVATPEMELLKLSIENDGFTQPIVAYEEEENNIVIDGFHRNRVGREVKEIEKKIYGYLPLTIIRQSQTDRNNRIASTIRHNRARGKHQIDSMSEIVIELKKRNWSRKRIGKELGMDEDEVLRLLQVGGLKDFFSDKGFSESWTCEGENLEDSNNFEDIKKELEVLDWADRIINKPSVVGWHDRTEQSSILYGKDNKQKGVIQKSRFKEEWFYYVYTTPITEGRAKNKKLAKKMVEEIYNEKTN